MTKDHVPPQLKEVFDIFVEIHSKKGFLVARGLIADEHKQVIIQSVLNCCAMCGPDNFSCASYSMPPDGGEKTSKVKNSNAEAAKGGQKQQVKFLDLAKLSAPRYQMEGLTICVQWYLEVLDKQTTRKNQDFHRKLKIVMEEIKAKTNLGTTTSTSQAGPAQRQTPVPLTDDE